jgi:hypothetical protein
VGDVGRGEGRSARVILTSERTNAREFLPRQPAKVEIVLCLGRIRMERRRGPRLVLVRLVRERADVAGVVAVCGGCGRDCGFFLRWGGVVVFFLVFRLGVGGRYRFGSE